VSVGVYGVALAASGAWGVGVSRRLAGVSCIVRVKEKSPHEEQTSAGNAPPSNYRG